MVGGMSSILRELAEVQHQLTSLPKDAEAQKHGLLARQDELHTRAARLADQIDEGRSTQDLLARLAELRWQLGALERQRATAPDRPTVRGQARTRPATGPQSESRIDARVGRIQSLLRKRGIDIR